MDRKPYTLNLKPVLYISLYTPKKSGIINYLFCFILFNKPIFYIYYKHEKI